MLLAHTNINITVRPDNDAPGLNSLVWGPPAPCTSPLLPTQHSRECVAKKQTPHSRCPRRDYVTRGHRQGGYIMFLFTTCRFCVICFQHTLVLFHIRWEPLATRPLCRITLPLPSPPILSKPPRETRARCLFRGATPLLILQFPQFPGHAHPNLAAFGRIPADHAVPVLVASPPPAGVRVGEARVHARPRGPLPECLPWSYAVAPSPSRTIIVMTTITCP